jgi:hypothetical protein
MEISRWSVLFLDFKEKKKTSWQHVKSLNADHVNFENHDIKGDYWSCKIVEHLISWD